MSEEFFDNKEKSGVRRDGYTPQSNGSHSRYGGQQPRARFNREARIDNTSYNAQRGYSENYRNTGYTSRYNGNEERDNYHQRPRFNGANSNGNFQSRNNYQQGNFRKNENRWTKRPSFNMTEGNGENIPSSYRTGRSDQMSSSRHFAPKNAQRTGYPYNQNSYSNARPRRNFSGNGYDPHAKYSQKKRLEYKEENYDPNEPIRLNKYLANAGVCSRRDADKYIEAGVVTVNGEVVTELGTKVLRSDVVHFHDNAVKMEKKVYVLLNKPKGYVTTSEDPQNRKTVMDLVKGACRERIYPVGRLDRNTTGVLLLTNDGEMASRLTHPKFLKKKIYHVHTDRNVTAADLRQIAEGITLEDGEIKADAIEYASETDKKQIGIEIHSGKNRIVRRIFEHLGYHVLKLDRVYFAGLTKKNVRRGDWRFLTEKEVNMLRMGAFE